MSLNGQVGDGGWRILVSLLLDSMVAIGISRIKVIGYSCTEQSLHAG